MIIRIPKSLEEEFKSFLEIGLCNLETNIMCESKLTESEKKVLKLIRKIIDKK